MRRLALSVALVALLPATSAAAAELDELLEQSREAAYSAEEAIVCSTPDGVRDAVVRVSQSDGEIRVASSVARDVEVKAGDGGWTLLRQGGVVTSASLDAEDADIEPLYIVEELGDAQVLGRSSTSYRLVRDGSTRAELMFDDESGALVATTTFTGDGEVYCNWRFISFDPTDPGDESPSPESPEELELSPWADAPLPETVAGFVLLDLYEDDEGFRFAYYSDGFFSFAVFETPSIVRLGDAETVAFGEATYLRSFAPGQATYVWEARNGGMALVGDLPPDLHEAVLEALPVPEDRGLLQRVWRTLFG